MKKLFFSFLVFPFLLHLNSCKKDDDGDSVEIISEGLATVVFSGDITNEQAVEVIKNDIGRNTNTILIQNTRNLTSLSLTGLLNAVNIEVTRNDKLENIDFPDLKEVYDNFSFSANDVLKTITVNNLSEASNISIFGLESLTNFSFQSLKNITGRFRVRSCNTLEEILLPSLEAVNFGNFEIRDNENLKQINTPVLIRIKGSLNLQGNIALEKINFSLLSESRGLTIKETKVPTINFPELEYLSSSFDVSSNELLTELSFPKLSKIAVKDDPEAEIAPPSYNITNNPLIKTLGFPGLEGAIRLTISNNDELTEINFPKINGYDRGDIRIFGKKITDLNFGSVTIHRNFLVESESEINNLNFSNATSFSSINISDMKADQVENLLNQLVVNTANAVTLGSITLTGSTSTAALENKTILEEKGIRISLNP